MEDSLKYTVKKESTFLGIVSISVLRRYYRHPSGNLLFRLNPFELMTANEIAAFRLHRVACIYNDLK